jgi:hypothetical protein
MLTWTQLAMVYLAAAALKLGIKPDTAKSAVKHLPKSWLVLLQRHCYAVIAELDQSIAHSDTQARWRAAYPQDSQ